MSFIAVGIVGGAAIGAIGSVVAGGEQASGEEQAANTQAGMFNTIVGQEQPYMEAGNSATAALNYLLGSGATSVGANGVLLGSNGAPLPYTQGGGTISPSIANLGAGYLTQTFNPTQAQLEAYPGYQFQLAQGDQAVQAAASNTSGALSGAALKQLSIFNQGLAASNYQNYFNQFQTQQNNIFDRLSGIASLGQNAASNTGNQGAQLGTGIAQAQAAAAGATAGGIVGATNSVGNAAQTYALASLLQNGGYGAAAGDDGLGVGE